MVLSAYICSSIQIGCTTELGAGADASVGTTFNASMAPNCTLNEKLSSDKTEICTLLIIAEGIFSADTTTFSFTTLCTPSPLLPEISSTSVQAISE